MKFDTSLRLLLAISLTTLQPAHAQQPKRVSADDEKKAATPRADERWRETHHPWRILVFHAFRPGILSLCENAHRWPDFERLALPDPADPAKGRWLTEAASVRWSGGTFTQAGDVPRSGRLLTDACFVLYVDDAPAMSGAVVSSFSARRFEFPALVVDRPAAGAGTPLPALSLTLMPGFPADPSLPAPAPWRAVLDKISGID